MINIKSIIKRSISGIVYVGLIVGAIMWGVIPLSVLFLIISIIAYLEFYKITHNSSEADTTSFRTKYVSIFLDLLIVIGIAFPLIVGLMIIPLLLIRFCAELYFKSKNPLRNIGFSTLSYLYIGLPMLCILFIMTATSPSLFLLAIFIFIWLNDTGAFIVGSALGKHRLFERISPKKSWEGFFGGLAFNLVAAYFFSRIPAFNFRDSFSEIEWFLLAIVVTVASTYGDLFESMYKRSLNIKDSGNIIPGHGGILDRIDSLLFVMPSISFMLLIYESLF